MAAGEGPQSNHRGGTGAQRRASGETQKTAPTNPTTRQQH